MKPDAFLARFGPLCKAYGEHYSVPPMLMLAMIAQESGWAEHPAAGTKRNYIGMKWTTGSWKRPGRVVNALEGQNTGATYYETTRFVEYATDDHCVSHLAETLANSSHYAAFRKAIAAGKPAADYVPALAANYTTDKKYPQAILSIMAQLEALDKPAPNVVT